MAEWTPSHSGTGQHIIVNRPGAEPHRAILDDVVGGYCEVREDQGTEWVPAEWVLPIESRPLLNAAAWHAESTFIDALLQESA